jgi:ribosomal protein S12 methylthiotransferase
MIKKKVFFVSLGCPKNLVDSEIMLGLLKEHGYEITDDPHKAYMVVINTCGFISEAKDESVDTILEYARLKDDSLKKLIVTGCMVQRYKEEFVKLLPEVDLFIGTNDYANIIDYLNEQEEKKSTVYHAKTPVYTHTSSTPRIIFPGQRSAYLKVAEGCRNHCTYCIIPSLRGDFRSRMEDDVIRSAKHLIENGIIELNLIAQDIGSYGIDLKGDINLASLLKKLVKLKDVKWIRLLYMHPKNVTDEVLDIMKDEDKVVKYIDLPIQHISSRILKLMNRHQSETEVRRVIEKIRKKLPDAALRTSLIVGFPGETKEDFDKLLRFVKEAKFDNLGVFKYSKEEGTKAYGMGGHVHHNTKKSRLKRILEAQAEISRENNKKYLNRVVPALIEGESEESEFVIQGRAAFQAPDIDGRVYITDGEYKVGEIMDVEIYETHTYDLIGRVV